MVSVQRAHSESIQNFLSRDHDRLDVLLARASADPNRIDIPAYEEFRRGLLKHVGMEEKILLPTIQRLRGGKPLPLATKLRLDHGAITALLIPSPTPPILKALRTILEQHNHLEENVDGGVYALCDQAAGVKIAEVLKALRAAPFIPPAPHVDGTRVIATVRRALEAAAYPAFLVACALLLQQILAGTPMALAGFMLVSGLIQ